ncbi:MAG: ribonuclease E activity regulator RraA [Neisseria sp.]|uniref:ribonuclease E activity regulator RraA n=1 Tax=Neisseria sp. TaxID=192066 RepID=UPI0026DD0D2D|nr:ribonuclease E activity regulator RraA [Neisseria sp.]MDO4641505.1 ribonuclease E activity regulator RraA [Neisseria sp.]
MDQEFSTADLIDVAPDTPSCETQFRLFGRRTRFCGRVRTVKCERDNGLVKQLMNSSSDGEVLVVDGNGSLASALMGDMIAGAGAANGWAGAVIFGAIRDSDAIGLMDFGVKALGTNPRKSAKNGEGETDVPVSFGGVTFHPGDYVYCDEDGILVSDKPIKQA